MQSMGNSFGERLHVPRVVVLFVLRFCRGLKRHLCAIQATAIEQILRSLSMVLEILFQLQKYCKRKEF